MVFRASQRSTSSSASIIFPSCSLSFDGHWGHLNLTFRPEQPRRKRPRFHIFPGSAPMRCTTLRLTTWPRVRHTFPGDTVDPGLRAGWIANRCCRSLGDIWDMSFKAVWWCLMHRKVAQGDGSPILQYKPVTHVNRRGRHSLPLSSILSSTRTLYRLVINWFSEIQH